MRRQIKFLPVPVFALILVLLSALSAACLPEEGDEDWGDENETTATSPDTDDDNDDVSLAAKTDALSDEDVERGIEPSVNEWGEYNEGVDPTLAICSEIELAWEDFAVDDPTTGATGASIWANVFTLPPRRHRLMTSSRFGL
ncbi:MAG: hypothetical protein H6683_00805 [Deltaproteobacteria bacterium]|nr:hypothetical protein [Deltaproteobacteria bacterium]